MNPSNDAEVRTKQREQLRQGVDNIYDEVMGDRLHNVIEELEAMRDGLGLRNVRNCHTIDDIYKALTHARALRSALGDLVTSVDAL